MKKMMALLMALALGVGAFVPTFAATNANVKGEKQEYLVQFKGPAEKGLLKAFGVKDESILREYNILPAMLLELTDAQAKGLMKHPQIGAVEYNAEVFAMAQQVPWGIPHVQATTAHTSGYTGAGVKVAILDTGIDKTHEDLTTNVKGGYSTFTDSANSDPYNDGGEHGTHVAGTVAALNNTVGVLGVAYNADLYAVKVLDNNGSGSYDNVVAGIEWAANNNMDIINMSLGGSAGSTILENAVNAAYNSGVLVIAAAGNEGNTAGTGDTVGYPAKYASAMAVAAVDSNNNRGSFSSTGPAVEIAAPGVSVLSSIPGNGYVSWNGTSMATPHVSGVAALVMQSNPALTNVQVRNLLNDTALDLGTPEWFGNGLVQAMAAINGEVPAEPDWVYETVTIESPHPYTNNYNATETYTKAGATRVAVHFSTLDTESGYDYVKVKDAAGNVVASLDGSRTDFWVEVPGDTANINLVTDSSVTANGYVIDQVKYVLDETTPPQETWVTETVSIDSPHPYTNNYNATNTYSKAGATKVAVHFSTIQTESGYDYVYVKDGNGNVVATYDGTQSDFWVEVNGDTLQINLVTDYSVTEYGYSIDQARYVMP